MVDYVVRKRKMGSLSVLLLLLCGVLLAAGCSRGEWWLDDSSTARQVQEIASKTAASPVSLPTWTGSLTPNHAKPLGEEHSGFEVLFAGSPPRSRQRVRYVQSADPEFEPEPWEGALVVEEVTIREGLKGTLEHGVTTTGTTQFIAADGERRPLEAEAAARVWWKEDGLTYLLEGRLVNAKFITRVAKSVRPVE